MNGMEVVQDLEADAHSDGGISALFNNANAALHFRYLCPTPAMDTEFRLSVERAWQELLGYYSKVPLWVVVNHGLRAHLYPFSHSPLSKVFDFSSASVPVYKHGNWISGAKLPGAELLPTNSYASMLYAEQFVVTLSIFFISASEESPHPSMDVLVNLLENAAVPGVSMLSLEEVGDVDSFGVDVEQLISVGEKGGTNVRLKTPSRLPCDVTSLEALLETMGAAALDDLYSGSLTQGEAFIYGSTTYNESNGHVFENEQEDYLYAFDGCGVRFVTCLMNVKDSNVPEKSDLPSLLSHVTSERNWPCWHMQTDLINEQEHSVFSRLIFLPDTNMSLSDCVRVWRHYPSMSFFSDISGTELTGIMRANNYGNVLYYHALNLNHQLKVDGSDHLELTCFLSQGALCSKDSGESWGDFDGGVMMTPREVEFDTLDEGDCDMAYADYVVSFNSDRELGRFMQIINEIDKEFGVVGLFDLDASCVEAKYL